MNDHPRTRSTSPLDRGGGILYAATMTIAAADRRRAMAAGFAAIALWGALGDAVGTGRSDPAVPDGCHDVRRRCRDRHRARARARRRLERAWCGWPVRVWLLGVGGLFGYHALYFAALQLAPPAEANLVNYLWPLLIVLLSAPLAGERLGWPHLVGALLGFAGVVLLAFGRGVQLHRRLRAGLCAGAGLRLRLVALLGAVAPLRRDADRRHRGVLRGIGRILSLACHLLFEHDGVAGHDHGMARRAGARPRPGRRRVLSLGPCRQARRHPRAGRAVLCHADPLDGAADRLRPRRADRHAPDRRSAGHRRRRAGVTRVVER